MTGWTGSEERIVIEQAGEAAARVGERLDAIAREVSDAIERIVPSLAVDERIVSLLYASVHENINTALHALHHEIPRVTAPTAAIEYARRLAQRDVGVTDLLRSYRVGQTIVQRALIAELLAHRETDGIEGGAALQLAESISAYVDTVVEELVAEYNATRSAWLAHHASIRAERVRTVLREKSMTAAAAQALLGEYRGAQFHVGMILWIDDLAEPAEALPTLLNVAHAAGAAAEGSPPLFVPFDETTAWVWLPLGEPQQFAVDVPVLAVGGTPARVGLALGEPAWGIEGLRRTHQQASAAHSVAVAAIPPRWGVTRFADVAPIAPMCAGLDAAQAWVAETLGALAADDERAALLRETASVFLANEGSYAATASHMMLHRNTAQYRLRKAEELRGRSLRDGRLDVELALLACAWYGRAVLLPASAIARPL